MGPKKLLCSFQRPPKEQPPQRMAGPSKRNSTHSTTPKRAWQQRPGPVNIQDQQPKRLPAAHLSGLPRKEVIQPHLPVRLPCYDFTPVTSPTFDGSLPCGLGHRLRVLLTPVV